ncbi:MAG: right-handed parallel beta-helix repeat-containing protein [Flavobacterium sp.]|nr:right-handed parallel beta-helix repeat-containing protein [Flavobacterium sp.]
MFKNTSILVLLFCSFCLTSNAKNYYFSSSSGNDANDGNENSPMATISKLNALVLTAGDKILFKKGDTFVGQILVSYSGSLGAPIIYDSYGTGDLPVLTASNGSNGIADPLSTIKIIGKQYLEFHNLTIENERFDAESGSPNDQAYGIYYQSFKTLPASKNFEDAVLAKYFRFSNLVVRNVYSLGSANTDFDSIYSSGIYFIDAFVNDVIIEDCYFTDLERTGVWLRKYVSDAIIRNNKFIDTGGSGTIMSAARRVLYENNLMRFTGSDSDSRMVKRGSGMWVFNSDDVVAQYNVSQHARGSNDSSGMHVDYGNSNILFQYNYLEDSAGGFCETLGENDNIIWRYNVSVNEGNKSGVNRLLWVSDYAFVPKKSTNVFVYNNTIYQGLKYQNVMADSKISLKATSFNFLNNIIYLEPSAQLGLIDYLLDVNTRNFAKNVMFGGAIRTNFKDLDANKIVTDPKFFDSGRRHFSGYKLMTSSPALGAALSFVEPVFPQAGIGIFAAITSNATKDIFGNPVNLTTATNIGAYNGSGETIQPNKQTYEAESATIVGGTEINCVNASGTKAVNVEANGKSLTFNVVNVPASELYFIKVFYANPLKSNLKLTVNGGPTETILLPNSDKYCYESGNPTYFPILKNLNAGNNVIKFENGIIDKIELLSVTEASLSVNDAFILDKSTAFLEKTLLSSDDSIKLLVDKKIEYQNAEISVYDIAGRLLSKKDYSSSEEIKLTTSNIGKGVKIVTARVGDYFFVDKIIIQ